MDLYDCVYLAGPGQIEDPKWTKLGPPLSVRSNCTTWLVWRHDGPIHKRRQRTVAPSRVARGAGMEGKAG